MRILGIDLGTATTGWGVLRLELGSGKLEDCGSIITGKGEDFAPRLEKIFLGVKALIKKWKVGELALECVFFNTNQKTALLVSQAQGVVKLAAVLAKVPVFEYTPLQVKMAMTGYGRAEKGQVGEMVKKTLQLKTVPKPDDTADALAVGLTHLFSRRVGRKLK